MTVHEDHSTQHSEYAPESGRKDWNRIHELFMQIPACIAVASGPELVFEFANPLYHQLVGSEESIVGKPLLEVLPDIDPGLLQIVRNAAFKGERFVANELPVTLDWDRSGKPYIKYFDLVYEPVMSKEGHPNGMMAFAHDISEQVHSRRKVQESEEKYRGIFETMDQGFCILEMIFDAENMPVDYRFLEVNPTFAKQTGLVSAEGKTARELVPDLERHWFDIYGKVALTGEAARFTEESEAMGRWFDVYAFRIGNAEKKRVALLFTDITERRIREKKIQESEIQFRTLANVLPQKIWIAQPDGNLTYSNQELNDYINIPDKNINQWTWMKLVHPDDREKVITNWKQALQTGGEFLAEFRFQRHDGIYRWHIARAIPQHDTDGNVIKWIGVSVDIEDQKNTSFLLEQKIRERTAELDRLNQSLLRSNADLEQFAYIASHDLKEPIRMISSYTSLLERRYKDLLDEEGRQYFSFVTEGVVRMNALISDILSYSRIKNHTHDYTEVDCNHLVNNVLVDLSVAISEVKAVIKVSKLPVLKGSEPQLHQLFLNLIANALKFRSPERTPELSVTARDMGREWLFAVEDNGIGIAEEYHEKIFILFKRLHTRDEYAGTGIGLGLCKKIVELHGGNIWVESKKEGGSVFKFTLATAPSAV